MDIDDPDKPEFASWRSYQVFEQRVRQVCRYIWDREVHAFLDTVKATLKQRDVKIRMGKRLWRAQLGIEYVDDEVEDGQGGMVVRPHPSGFCAARMKPLATHARDGRASPAGIPVLYLASSEKTAISEVRPWVGAKVSIAQCKVKRDLRALDLTVRHGEWSWGHFTDVDIMNEKLMPADKKDISVWTDIDNAFSTPITQSESSTDYVPTQILTELFKNIGYDAIIYRSGFVSKGYNIATFNLDDADVINCAPYGVKQVEVTFEEIGSRWFTKEQS